jgi:hypothetical protein
MQKGRVLFLDNLMFRYDVEKGLFASLSLASEDVTLEDVRRRGMTLSLYEVVVVRGIPYLYEEKADTLYRLGNVKERMSGAEFELEELRGMASYPFGEEFRKVVAREKEYVVGKREAHRYEDRSTDR